MFFRNFINRKINTKFETRIRRKVPYLRKNKTKYPLNHLVKKYDKGEDVYFDRAPLPDLYYKNEIVLMPKNINTLFAYWEVREDDFKILKEEKNVFDTVTIILLKNNKVYRKISGLSRYGSYYISNVQGNRSYQAKLGFENANGDFFEIVSSTRSIVPSGKISRRRANTWAIPYMLNGQVKVNFFDKNNLPDDHILRQEITDDVIITKGLLLNSYYRLDENGNIIFLGSSNLGSSNNFVGSSK